ncbi:DUF2851 family protein [Salegentibacter sp. F188]|uniref:DUF2851 family protein n=1 Tax=Autumnicola patrickiae TaxID=3075591 RepID=A0ABU3DXY0_9FLAO|nr:DUF2851 family protein [Salegentibacter sp. F188]MDT0688563.1 DUF2851 family protein [Salegentibacter sp. F188]
MQEDFLHYLWKFKKFKFHEARTTDGEEIVISEAGIHNKLSGPDFFNAKVRVGDQLWAGNVEIHIKSSDWYAHHHETDENYDNVILHVVWQHDVDIFRKDSAPIPTLELEALVDLAVFQKYYRLSSNNKKWINCENSFPEIDQFQIERWLERLYFERLEEKSLLITELLEKSGNDWEAVLFQLLAKNFGLNVNGEAFLSIARSFDFKIIKKNSGDKVVLQSLLLGQAGLLDGKCEDPYFQELKNNFQYLKHKYSLDNSCVLKPKFFRLRPDNFPTIRLVQLAEVYTSQHNLFMEVTNPLNLLNLVKKFQVEVDGYWLSHYSFGRKHRERRKKTTANFINLIMINTIVPFNFVYASKVGVSVESVVELARALIAEENAVVSRFYDFKPDLPADALHSQALLHLKKNYCDKNRCMECELGLNLLQ